MHNLGKVLDIVEEVHNIKVYPSQVKAIKEMYRGNIVNMETGEGKTIVIAITAVLKALNGDEVVVITPNEYLNERDYNTCREIALRMGITVGENGDHTDKNEEEKRLIYGNKIVYSTCSEFVFDYLRGIDMNKFERVLLKKHLIIDEIDQVLVDNSSTDYTISYGDGEDISKYDLGMYNMVSKMCGILIGGEITISTDGYDIKESERLDFIFNKTEGYVYLTNKGDMRVRALMGLGDSIDIDMISAILNTLNATHVLEKGVDYIVSEGKISIIDKNNGRYKSNNIYSSGLNLAIEIAEGLEISEISSGERGINGLFLFSQFEYIVGCSGTAYECREIFMDILGVRVKKIKRHKVKNVVENYTKYYEDKESKYVDVMKLIGELNERGLPILVIAEDDNVGEEFNKLIEGKYDRIRGLTNKNLSEEKDIIAGSGGRGSILVSTLISGRGTDIKIDKYIDRIGGLQVIFIARFGNKRAEQQVIGRTGRQGESGKVYMYSSMDDKIYSGATITEKQKIHKYINENKGYKIDRIVEKLQYGNQNRVNKSIKRLYKVNTIKNIFENYIREKYPWGIDMVYYVEEYIKGCKLSDDRGYYECVLGTQKFIDKKLMGEE